MPVVTDIELLDDTPRRLRPDWAFLQLRRLMAQNRHADGGTSRPYPIDVIDRPALDAVAVCAYARSPRGVDVLTRAGLRPAALFRRERTPALPEPVYLRVEELVAGVLEPGEQGRAALQRRAAEELHEEAGLIVDPVSIQFLGGPVFMLPGIASEKIHIVAVEVSRQHLPDRYDAPGHGDGSPLEEGAELRWRELHSAIAACESGEIEDAKTEVALRRLAARLVDGWPVHGN